MHKSMFDCSDRARGISLCNMRDIMSIINVFNHSQLERIAVVDSLI